MLGRTKISFIFFVIFTLSYCLLRVQQVLCAAGTPSINYCRRTDRQTGRQAGRQAGRQTDRQTNRQTDRHTPMLHFVYICDSS